MDLHSIVIWMSDSQLARNPIHPLLKLKSSVICYRFIYCAHFFHFRCYIIVACDSKAIPRFLSLYHVSETLVTYVCLSPMSQSKRLALVAQCFQTVPPRILYISIEQPVQVFWTLELDSYTHIISNMNALSIHNRLEIIVCYKKSLLHWLFRSLQGW